MLSPSRRSPSPHRRGLATCFVG